MKYVDASAVRLLFAEPGASVPLTGGDRLVSSRLEEVETFRAVDIIQSGKYPFEKMHTLSLPLAQAEDAIHALAGHIPGVNPIHLAIEPGAPAVTLRG